ncbi:MAG: polyphosphate kinase 1 [Planctomycetes bacterium]|nr:polyphosphate kinase 1 [Planctomycetota bacterium]NUQ33493.1 polyphosphate kinase 1 [Planctomycetaceae bacterium]
MVRQITNETRYVDHEATTSTDLVDPALYIHREQSLIEFDKRVLAQARDPDTPLLERLRFLTICSSNLDEFFEIRISGLKQQVEYGISQPEADGLSAGDALTRISATMHELVTEQYRVFQNELLPALSKEGINLLRRGEWTDEQTRWIRQYFDEQVLPVLTPVALDPSHPFPRILNKSLNFIVSLEGVDAYGRASRIAIVQVPRSLPRVIQLPVELSKAGYDFVMLSSIVHEYMDELFRGMKVAGAYQFRVTRNSDLWVDEEAVDDLLFAIKGELRSRAFGDAVRLEIADNCPPVMTQFLLTQFGLTADELYRVDGPVNLHRLNAIIDKVNRPDLKYKPFVPSQPLDKGKGYDIFAQIRKGDILLHHPYQSFLPVIDLARQAAADPEVLSIKLTLYRTDADSPLAKVLIDAARAGKDVTAVIELRARFDEAHNIDLATRLQEAGANVAYGIVGFKAHAKMMMVVRREDGKIRRYVHLGTGNYHAVTARIYTDISYMTCDREIGDDVHQLFMQLTSIGRASRLAKLLQSPFTLEKKLLQLIDEEIAAAREGKPARIMARMNAITEPRIIRALYKASMAGVQIDLIVRGVCCLRPGMKGISDNIRVRSIVGRFLEHSRVFYFFAGGEEKVFAGSADWMQRNLHRRVETCFPILDKKLKARVIEETLSLYFKDNTQAWDLRPDGSYVKVEAGSDARVTAQQTLLNMLADQDKVVAK